MNKNRLNSVKRASGTSLSGAFIIINLNVSIWQLVGYPKKISDTKHNMGSGDLRLWPDLSKSINTVSEFSQLTSF